MRLATVFGIFFASPLVAQADVKLQKPAAEFPEPFTRVASIREVAADRVLVSDTRDKIVQLLDLRSGTARAVGREGQGPGEYALPGALLPLPGGKSLLQDILGRRYLEIGPDGTVGATVSMSQAGSGRGGMMLYSLGANFGDNAGRVYMQAPPFDPRNPEASKDSVPLLRWDRANTGLDTVAWIGVPKADVQGSGSGNQRMIRVGMAKEFAPQEAWGVAGDGSIARVTPEPYRVHWYPADGGSARPGPTLPWTPIKVTKADKEAVIEARKNARATFVSIGSGGNRSTSGGGRSSGNFQLPDPEFEDTKPPFSGRGSVLVSADGEVWVRKNQRAGVKNPRYDVFDRSGRLVRTVTLAPGSRVLGFGNGTVYVARTDEDDLEYLQRFAR